MQPYYKVIAGIISIYVFYCFLLFILQRKIIFPRHMIEIPRQDLSVGFAGLEKIWIDTVNGKIESWFLPPFGSDCSKPFPVLIRAHRNAELIDFWPQEFKRFSAMGLGLLLVEYPGYGRSSGNPSQQHITEAFVKAYDILVDKKEVDQSKIIFFGRSLGGGVVCSLAEKRPSAALMLMSTFVNTRSLASNYLVPPFLVRDPFNNLDAVAKYTGPVLIIHGLRDDMIPYSHAEALYKAARHGKMITYNCGHNDCPPNDAVFWKDMKLFFQSTKIID